MEQNISYYCKGADRTTFSRITTTTTTTIIIIIIITVA